MTTTTVCSICGAVLVTSVPSNWHPSKLENRAEWDLQEHVRSHSFTEVLRYEIRRDLDQVPAEERATLIRDVYRQLLGSVEGGRFMLNEDDGAGTYSIEEALGTVAMYELWHASALCDGRPCVGH